MGRKIEKKPKIFIKLNFRQELANSEARVLQVRSPDATISFVKGIGEEL
ncbi:hypothetical protein [Fischerella sp. PCC 9605]